MKRAIFLLFASLIYAQNVPFINPFESNSTNLTIQKTLKETNETNVSKEQNVTKEEIFTFKSNFKTFEPTIKIALIIDKKKFFKYLPSLINSVNSYLLDKNVNYQIKVFGIDTNLSTIEEEGFKNVLVYSLNKDYIKNLANYSNINFYIPVFNKNDIQTNAQNLFFGGIEYKNQISQFIPYMDTNKAISINDNTLISNKLLNTEKEFNLSIISFTFPNIYYERLNQNYVFLNIDAGKSAQVLSNITAKNIDTKLIFSSQIDYNPLLIEITQPQNVKKLLIANSIISVPKEIEDIALNTQSDLKYNWLNYSTDVFLNKIYNNATQGDLFYMSDFRLYIFNNQINYKTKIYQIIDGAFKPIE
jgi:hypothetical protein